MLEYLVTSKARRRLLMLLWGERASGSASALAKRAHVAFASVHRELQAMKTLGLVVSAREAGAEAFRANQASPLAPALRDLVKRSAVAAPPSDRTSRRARGELRQLGAPLHDAPVAVGEVERALVQGVQLAHRDATVARVLPVCFYRQRDAVRPEVLERRAREAGEKRAVGFFLDLTATLSEDRRFARWASRFRDRRYAVTQSFFPASRMAADPHMPAVARRWKLRLDMGLDTFASTFDKFAHAA
jgi:hypothetical protein